MDNPRFNIIRRINHTLNPTANLSVEAGHPQYGEAGNLERLYADDGFDLIERHDHDPDVAAAALLGRDMAAIVIPEVRDQILAVIAPAILHR